MLGNKRKSKQPKFTKNDSFIIKLYSILNTQDYEKIIHWSSDGKFIVISDISKLTQKILPQYYNHKNYSSFVRQLNIYNFHKIAPDIQREEDAEYFQNEKFQKNIKIEEISKIIPKTRKNLVKIITQDDLNEMGNDEDKINNYFNLVKKDKLNDENKRKVLLLLLSKTQENITHQNGLKSRVNEITNQKYVIENQIQICYNKIIEQSLSLKKIKDLYLELVSILIKNNNSILELEASRKRSTTLKDLFNKFYLKNYNTGKIVLNNKNIVQKGEAFSINNIDEMDSKLKEYLNFNNIDLLSIKSGKISDSFCDDFSLGNNFKNFEQDLKNNKSIASSYSMLNNSNLCNLNINPNLSIKSFGSNSIISQ